MRNRMSSFRILFNFKDELAEGRCYNQINQILSSIIANLTGGVFYARFLLLNGINIVNVGIMAFVPYIASFISLLSPWILNHFKKRKAILAVFSVFYYVINILGITLLPKLVQDERSRLLWFIVIIFVSSVFSYIRGNGYGVWFINFLPEEKLRFDYFAIQTNLNYLIGQSFTLLIAFLADRVRDTPAEPAVINGIRYVALLLAFVDVFILCKPREYPYTKTMRKNRAADIAALFMRNKAYLRTMAVIFFCTFINSMPSGVLYYHLINHVGIPSSFTYLINLLYCFYLYIFLPHWNGKIQKHGWFKTYIFSTWLLVPVHIMYACVTQQNYVWLFLLLRLIQHYVGMGREITFSNFPYINLPENDRDYFITFQGLGTSLSTGLGTLMGTGIVSWIGSGSWMFLGHTFTAVPILLLIEAAGTAFIAILVTKIRPILENKQS